MKNGWKCWNFSGIYWTWTSERFQTDCGENVERPDEQFWYFSSLQIITMTFARTRCKGVAFSVSPLPLAHEIYPTSFFFLRSLWAVQKIRLGQVSGAKVTTGKGNTTGSHNEARQRGKRDQPDPHSDCNSYSLQCFDMSKLCIFCMHILWFDFFL